MEPAITKAPGAEQVAEGLWLLAGRPKQVFNVYVMGDVLLDAGTRHAARRILRQVSHLALTKHVLTHAHVDHVGSSHEICETLGLPLICGEADAAVAAAGMRSIAEERPLPLRLADRLFAGPGHPVSATLKEGDRIGRFEVLEVPGHSPGHLAFWREEDRVLVLGDVLFNVRGLSLPPAAFTPDPETNLASARRLAALEPETICFGHGPPLRDGKRFRDFVLNANV